MRKRLYEMYSALIVDDEPAICNGLRKLIDWEGCGFSEVQTALNGREALEALRNRDVDLVVTDIKMPEISGLDLIDIIRRTDGGSTEIIVISGYNDFKFAQQAIKHGVKSYLLKPVDAHELAGEVRKVRESLDLQRYSTGEDFIDKWHFEWNNSALINAMNGSDKPAILTELAKLDGLLSKHESSLLLLQSIIGDILKHANIMSEKYGINIRDECIKLLRDIPAIHSKKEHEALISRIGDIILGVCDSVYFGNSKTLSERMPVIIKYIELNYRQELTLKRISGVFYINQIYLGQIFKEATGYYFNEYLNKVRIDKAAELMAQTSLPLSEISAMVGYANEVSFYRNFMKIKGQRPSDYKAGVDTEQTQKP